MASPPRTTIELRILRQESATAKPRWEEFSLPWRPELRLISCLIEIREQPVTKPGAATTPIEWEVSCADAACGECSVLVNGFPRPACTARIDELEAGVITLEPLSKFPVVRDLVVDRATMLDSFERVRADAPIEAQARLPAPGGARVAPPIGARSSHKSTAEAGLIAALSRCTMCGCCLEACPQVNERSDYMGPAPIIQALRYNRHPSGRASSRERMAVIMGRGGIAECGNAQNCLEVCPVDIPITEALGQLGRETTGLWLSGLFGRRAP